jgi:putative flippase GtrA
MRCFKVNIIYANTAGVILGFIIHYILSSKSVFDMDYGVTGFIVYMGTFIVGLALADYLISTSYNHIFQYLPENIRFLLSKGVSLVVPFFVLYYARRYIYNFIGKHYSRNGDEGF